MYPKKNEFVNIYDSETIFSMKMENYLKKNVTIYGIKLALV